jgi:hypothetical protein
MAAKQKTEVAVKKPGTGLVSWQDRMAKLASQAVEQEASVSSGQFIGTRAGQLSWNGSPVVNNKLHVIVCDSILENAYYPGEFDPDNPQPPVCFAFGRKEKDMAPHADSSDKQHDTCTGCQRNEFGSAERGKGKACKNIRRIGLIAAEPMSAEAIEKGEVAYLKTPVTSVKGWAAYVRTLEALDHMSPQGVVTEISSVTDPKSQFKIIFNKVGKVPDKFMGLVMDRHDEVANAIEFPYSPPSSELPVKKGAAKKGKKY